MVYLIGMCCCGSYGCQAVYSRIGSQRVWVQTGVPFPTKLTNKMVEYFISTKKTEVAIQNIETIVV